ncbi:MAG: DUF4147 domain-containing protein [Leptospiraceae bacterium]|nr:DUF4147 domain-containing protein [Leptospiraceae bacterium]
MQKFALADWYWRALAGIRAETVIARHLQLQPDGIVIQDRKYAHDAYERLYVYAVGKAALPMARAALQVLGSHVSGGLVVSHQSGQLPGLDYVLSSHPQVTERSLQAARLLQAQFARHQPEDLVLFLLSGGASAMMEEPQSGLTLAEFSAVNQALLTSGIPINALNVVRSAISRVKGGRLAAATRARGEVLIVSDVIGDDLATIGSGPMLSDRFRHTIIASNRIALAALASDLQRAGQPVEIVNTALEGSAEDCARVLAAKIRQLHDQGRYCILFGGECVTRVTGNGRGGRNQELALHLMLQLQNDFEAGLQILCAGSDGLDGNSPAAGAFLDSEIYAVAKHKKLDARQFLQDSDSYTFFSQLGYAFEPGITGTNVMDFVFVAKGLDGPNLH